jgi:hypothetical protein
MKLHARTSELQRIILVVGMSLTLCCVGWALPKESSERVTTMNTLFSKKVQTRQDANAVATELVELLPKLNEAGSPQVAQLRTRLADAEYSFTVRQMPSVTEANIALAFNLIASRFSAPSEVRVSQSDVRNFRKAILLITPAAISTTSNGEVGPSCRPFEALYILFLLDFNGGAPKGLRHLSDSRIPRSQMTGLDKQSESMGRRSENELADKYFLARHRFGTSATGSEILSLCNDVLSTLGI